MANLENLPPQVVLQPLRDERANRIYLTFEEGCRAARLSWFYLLALTVLTGLVFSAAAQLFEDLPGWQQIVVAIAVLGAAFGVIALLYVVAATHLWSSSYRIGLRADDIGFVNVRDDLAQSRMVDRLRRQFVFVRLVAHLVAGSLLIAVLVVAVPALSADLRFGLFETDPRTGEAIYGNSARGAAISSLGNAQGTFAGNDGRNAAIGAAVGAVPSAGVARYMDSLEDELHRGTAGSGIEVRRNGDRIELVAATDAAFIKNGTSLNASFRQSLDRVAETLVMFPKTKIDIVGHTDSDGAEAYNKSRSAQFALLFESYLAAKGVPRFRMSSEGMGENQPILPNATAAGKAVNRRVGMTIDVVSQ